MRILLVTAYYPPFEIGGWGQLTRDLNVLLQARGHETLTLVSTHRATEAHAVIPNVRRVLEPESAQNGYRPKKDFSARQQRWQRNKTVVEQSVAEFQPDVVFIHGMWGLSRQIPWLFEQICEGRVAYYLANNWPYTPDIHQRFWQDAGVRPGFKQAKKIVAYPILKKLAREYDKYPLRMDLVMCVSQWTLDGLAENSHVDRANLHVVHNGINPETFAPPVGERHDKTRLELLYAGSLVVHKGVQTAIDAMAKLKQDGVTNVHLTVMGRGHPDYEALLKQSVAADGTGNTVTFRDWVGREEMPAMLCRYDVLLLTSIGPDALPRIVQEAMATEMTVIGTLTGGTGEILVNEQTGLTYPPGDETALAACIQRLAEDKLLCSRLAKAGRQSVLKTFTMERMVDQAEAQLTAFIAANQVAQPL